MFSAALTQAIVKMVTDSERELQARQHAQARPEGPKQSPRPFVLFRVFARRFLKTQQS
jgi:hypothetical protein